MKKISIVLLILMIFNFIYSNLLAVNVYSFSDEDASMDMSEYKSIADEGKADVNGESKDIELQESDVGATSSLVGSFFVDIAKVVALMASEFTIDGGLYYTDSDFSAEETGLFTINSLVFGEFLIFNPKIYQKSTDLNSNIQPSDITKMMDAIKQKGYDISQVMVKIGTVFSLPLIMLAILKAISASKASDLAAWKKILTRWVLCIFLLMFYQYILITIDVASDSLIDGFWKTRVGLEKDGYQAFEVSVEEEISKQYANTGGVTSLAYAVVFVILVILQILFLIKYAMRTFGILFLFIIAPMVILLHSVNLMLGRTSNMLGDFFKDYILLNFMQPLHALFYLIFFFSISELAIKVPILGILLLFALLRAINIAKAMFGWELGASLFTRK